LHVCARAVFQKETPYQLDPEKVKTRALKYAIDRVIEHGNEERRNEQVSVFSGYQPSHKKDLNNLDSQLHSPNITATQRANIVQAVPAKTAQLQRATQDVADRKNRLAALKWPTNVDTTDFSRFLDEPAIGTATGIAFGPGLVLIAEHVASAAGPTDRQLFQAFKAVFDLRLGPNNTLLTGPEYEID
jgi:hypothetical protein